MGYGHLTIDERERSRNVSSTHVDRKARYTIAVKVADKSAETVTMATLKAMKPLPSEKIKTMTFDNGKEFAGFKQLEHTQALRFRLNFANESKIIIQKNLYSGTILYIGDDHRSIDKDIMGPIEVVSETDQDSDMATLSFRAPHSLARSN